MSLLLSHPDSPHIRAIGFLYLRYAGDPQSIWKFIEPYLYDDEPVAVKNNATKTNNTETIGSYVRFLFTNKEYYGTMLPRFPIQIERDLQVKLLQAEKIEERANKHSRNSNNMRHFRTLGSKVIALYGDDENPVTWYDAVIDRVITADEESGRPLRNPKFIVTFPEYGNTETVTLGKLEMPGSRPEDNYPARDYPERGYGRSNGNRDYRGNNEHGRGDHRGGNDRWGRGHGGGRSALPTEDDLYEEVRRRERENVTASDRSGFARRPPSAKASLMSHTGDRRRYTSETNPHPPREKRARSPPPREQSNSASAAPTPAPPREKTAEEMAAIREKKRKLMARYG